MYYGNTKDAKAAMQFSRRHETPAALNQARDLRELDQAAKGHDVEIRQAARAERSDIQQLAELLRRPGNSAKEATRLFWRIIESRPTQGWTDEEKEILTTTAERIFPEGDFVLAA